MLTPEQLQANVELFYQSIQPAALFLQVITGMSPQQKRNATINVNAFETWLAGNATGDETYSYANLRRAYEALKDTGTLQFEVKPPSQKNRTILSAEIAGRKNHAIPETEEAPVEQPWITKAKNEENEARLGLMLQAIENEIQTYAVYSPRGKNHSLTSSRQAELREIFNRYKADPMNCEEKVKQKIRSYPDS